MARVRVLLTVYVETDDPAKLANYINFDTGKVEYLEGLTDDWRKRLGDGPTVHYSTLDIKPIYKPGEIVILFWNGYREVPQSMTGTRAKIEGTTTNGRYRVTILPVKNTLTPRAGEEITVRADQIRHASTSEAACVVSEEKDHAK
jgi:hypothetical protein